MGIFFKTERMAPALRAALQEAYAADPGADPDRERTADAKAEQIVRSIQGEIVWARLIVAFLLLVAVFLAAIYTGQQPSLQDLYKVLVHAVELVLGGVLGVVIGEIASR